MATQILQSAETVSRPLLGDCFALDRHVNTINGRNALKPGVVFMIASRDNMICERSRLIIEENSPADLSTGVVENAFLTYIRNSPSGWRRFFNHISIHTGLGRDFYGYQIEQTMIRIPDSFNRA